MLLEALRGLTAFACLYLQVTESSRRVISLGFYSWVRTDRGARLEMVWRQVQENNLKLQLTPLGWRGVEGWIEELSRK